MLGSVKKDGDRGTWLFVVDLSPAADGKRRQKKCRGFPTKKAAQAALSELVGRAQRGPIAEPGRQTLAAYLEGWLKGLRVSRTGQVVARYDYGEEDNPVESLPLAGFLELLDRWRERVLESARTATEPLPETYRRNPTR